MTWWLGLSGGIGSGKSAVAKCFGLLGVPIIDADVIAHQLTAADGAALPAIYRHWGETVFAADGMLNRQQLRQIIFRQPRARQQLEAILHPLIFAHIRQAQHHHTEAHVPYGIVDIPLLAERPRFQQLTDRVLIIDADDALRLQRVVARNGLDENDVRVMMAQQASRQQRLALADDVIVNNTDWQHIDQEVARLHHFYQTLTHKP